VGYFYFFLLILSAFPLVGWDVDEIESWINQKREMDGLNRLVGENALCDSAELYSEELMERGMLIHRDREGRGPLERYARAGGTALAAGEILGTCSYDSPSEELFNAWWNSPTHREQILNPRWNCIGIALKEQGGVLVAVVEFSSSLLSEYSFRAEKGGVLFSFHPVPGYSMLSFRYVLERKLVIWEEGGKESFFLGKENFPLLFEVSVPEDSQAFKGSNRFVLTSIPE
jgi:hypothetical protein